MSLSSRKRWSPDKVILFQALTLAIIFHLLLGLLFYVPAPDRKGTDEKHKQISMMSLNGKTPLLSSNISSWLEYGDPTVVLKSSSNDGIKLLLGKKKQTLPEENLSYFKINDPNTLKRKSFDSVSAFYKQKYSGNNTFAAVPPALLPLKIDRRIKQTHPMWKNEAGEILPLDISGLKKLISLRRPERATSLEVKFRDSDLLPRVRVIESSGSEELDNKAVNAFLANYKVLNIDEESSVPLFYSIEWRDYGED